MDRTTQRLMEIAGHLEVIAENMKSDSETLIKNVLMGFHADEITELANEIKSLIDFGNKEKE